MRQLALTNHAQAVHRHVVVAISCDRCGADVAPRRRMADLQDVPGVVVIDDVADSGHEWRADLCVLCADGVRAFIAAGDGPGMELIDHRRALAA